MKRLRCRGVAAIEAALVLLATSVLLVNFIYCGRLAWTGAALDGAAAAAARYLSKVPIEVLHDSSQRGVALAVARAMVDDTLAAASVDVQELEVDLVCDPGPCASLSPAAVPAKVGVHVAGQFSDEQFGRYLSTRLAAFVEVGRDN